MKKLPQRIICILICFSCLTIIKAQKTNRQYFPDGSYADVTKNTDGTTTYIHHSICFICKGSKTCNICHGWGGMTVGYYNRQWRICASCTGNGKCKYCNGTGEKVMMHTSYPSSQTTVSHDLHSGRKHISTARTHGETDSDIKTNKCYVCKGTGKEKRPITSVTSSSDYKKVCPECNEVMPSYDLHIHQTCTGCKGTGYY